MVRSILAIAFVIIFLGTIGCSKKVKKAPATTEGKQTEQSMGDRQFPEVAQAEDDYEGNDSYDEDYSSDDAEVTDDIDNSASDNDTAAEEDSGDDATYEDESEDTENSDY